MKGEHAKPMAFATVCLIIMAVFLLVFTIATMVVFCFTQSEPSTLVACVFSVCGAETIGLLIKKILKSKLESEDNSDEHNNDI